MLLRGELRKYTKKINFENFDSALYSTSVSMPLRVGFSWMTPFRECKIWWCALRHLGADLEVCAHGWVALMCESEPPGASNNQPISISCALLTLCVLLQRERCRVYQQKQSQSWLTTVELSWTWPKRLFYSSRLSLIIMQLSSFFLS